MDAEVGLTIAVQVKLAQCDSMLYGLFKDRGRHLLRMPRNFLGVSHIH